MEDQNRYNGYGYDRRSDRNGDRTYANAPADGEARRRNAYTADPRYTRQYGDISDDYPEEQPYAPEGNRMQRDDFRPEPEEYNGYDGYDGYEPETGEGYSREPVQYTADPRYTVNREETSYSRNGETGRVRVPRGQYGSRYVHADEEPEDNEEETRERPYAGRRRDTEYAPRTEEPEEDYDEPEDYDEAEGDEEEKEGFLNGLLNRLAQVPAKKLAIAGVSIAALLIVVILLVLLLPRGGDTERERVVAATATPEPTATPVRTPVPTSAPTPTQHPVSTPLQFGMESPVVAEIQQRLIDLGYMDYPEIDGVKQVTTKYGRTTKTAVQIFQQKNGLDSDGWCGQTTYDLLMSDEARAFSVTRGDQNDMVKKLQQRLAELGYLKAEPTGKCSDNTVKAIRAFQEKNGLAADGQAGPLTLELVYSDEAIDAAGEPKPTQAPEETVPEALPEADAEAEENPTEG